MNPFKKIAKKHLGQNFLIDERMKKKIIDIVAPTQEEIILEIGPGLGALTQPLIATGATVYAVEKDPAMIARLQHSLPSARLHLIEGDFLTIDLTSIPQIHKIIGNIPYNISTPIIQRLIACQKFFPYAFLTVQREFAQRLTARPGTKDYGSLTCLVQYYADVQIHFHISPQSFRPVPKITSSFIQLSFREPADRADDERILFQITQSAFAQRRKTLLNALSSYVSKNILQTILKDLKIDVHQRPDTLALNDYIRLANALTRAKQTQTSCSTQKTNAS